jgi:hypothetical protein
VALLAQHGPGDEELDLSRPVPHGREGQLALPADEKEATGDGDPLLRLGPRGQVAVRGPELAERRAAVEAVGVRVRAGAAEGLELGQSHRLLGGQASGLLDLRGLVVLHGPVTLASPRAQTAAGCGARRLGLDRRGT